MAKMMQMVCSKLSLGNIIILFSIINNVTKNERNKAHGKDDANGVQQAVIRKYNYTNKYYYRDN
jgi:hypothetical protein